MGVRKSVGSGRAVAANRAADAAAFDHGADNVGVDATRVTEIGQSKLDCTSRAYCEFRA
jgi:hypothetical protein